MVPGILYRNKQEAIPFSVDALKLNALLRHGATLVDVDVDGANHASVIKDYQVHPVRSTLVHVDFQEVSMDEVLKTVVAIHLTGEEDAPGVKDGGIVNHVTRELNIESTPNSIPEYIEVDMSSLATGDSLTVESVKAPAGVTITDEPDTVICTIALPRAVVASAVEGEEGAEGEGAAEGGDAPAEGGGE
jgi:large subunit ribosomal protein L25